MSSNLTEINLSTDMATSVEAIKFIEPIVIYTSFGQAAIQLYELEPIDYFLAKELLNSLTISYQQATSLRFNRQQQDFFFHLFVLLNKALRDGNSCLFIDNIAHHNIGAHSDEQGYTTHQGYSFPNAENVLGYLALVDVSPTAEQLVVLDGGKLFLRRYYQFEQELSLSLQEKLGVNDSLDETLIKACLAHLFVNNSAEVNSDDEPIDWQKISVANAFNKNLSVIAGGPGTGKTYTVTKLLAGLVWLHQKQLSNNEQPLRIMLSAPTGKAAQRLTESIIKAIKGFRGVIDDNVLDSLPTEAKTLHRLLGVIPHSPNFRHHQDKLLAVDVLLIDEVSMVDLPMMARVLRALPAQAKVILLGDADQLPSVEVGSILADIAPRPHLGYSKANISYLQKVCGYTLTKQQAKKAGNALDHVTFLTQSRRFDGKGLIGRLAKYVIDGDIKNSWQLISKPSETLISANANFLPQSSVALEDWLPELVKTYYQPLFALKDVDQAFAQLTKFRILAATRKGEAGVEYINQQVREILAKKGLLSINAGIYHAQPIMVTENDYRLGLYNGDVGLIWRHQLGHLMAVFEQTSGDYMWVIPSRLPKFESVYAMTIHKTQGSEFNHVAMILPKQRDNKLLSRELLYTGITRAKSILSLFCFEHVWKSAVECQVKRESGITLTLNK